MRKSKTLSLIICALFTALIAVGAFIKVPVPYVPFTLQVMFTTLAALIMGPKLGALSSLTYMILGLIGLPIFTEGGGIWYVLKPTFGYIIGFIIGSYVTGKIAYKTEQPSYKRMIGAAFAGLGIIYLCGMIYFGIISNLYLGNAIGVIPIIIYCFLMFVPGDIVLCSLSAILCKRLIPILRKSNIISPL